MTNDRKRKLNSSPSFSEGEDFEFKNESEDVLNVEFDFFEFSQVDFHPIKQFLISYFGNDPGAVYCSDLADWILNSSIGSTVKCDGESGDPYAFISLLGLTGKAWKNHAVSTQAKDWLIRHTRCERTHALLQAESKSVALILNERLINMPWHVSGPLLRLLLEELQSNAEAEEAYRFEHLTMLFPLYTDEEGESDEEDSSAKEGSDVKRVKSLSRKKKSQTQPTESYLYFEAEYLEQFAEFTFHFKCESKVPKRKGMVFRFDQLEKGVSALQKLVDESTCVLSQGRK